MEPSLSNKNQKETASVAANVYRATIGKVSPTDDSLVLHYSICWWDLLKWTPEHFDTYLESAHIIIEQQDESVG
jgi:hypothetical protein